MKIMISVVSSNKALLRLKRRCTNELEELKKNLTELHLVDPEYEGIIFTLVDKDSEFFYKVANNDNFYQVEHGYENAVDVSDKKSLLGFVGDKLLFAINKSVFDLDHKNKLCSAVRRWSSSIE